MAHETLKTLITNNIKTNGQNAITAQILQDVLIAMVDEYPDVSGFATRTWVQQQDYAPKDWVENKHYATQAWANQQLENYLPLEGGTMAGPITYGDDTDGKYEFFSQGLIFSKGVNRYAVGVSLGLDEGLPYIHFFTRGGQLIGTEITHDNVTSDAFIKHNGTAAQFLKADGSVDENTYATKSALLGYLPLTGGTMTGALNFNSSDYKIDLSTASGTPSLQLSSANHIYISAGGWIELMADDISCWGDVNAPSFIKNGGTADQVLCADGSVKTLAQLKAALDAI